MAEALLYAWTIHSSRTSALFFCILLFLYGCQASPLNYTDNPTKGPNENSTDAPTHQQWSYEEENLWQKNFDFCGKGHHQSPIAIRSLEAVLNLTHRPLYFNEGYRKIPDAATVLNTGHTAQIVITENATMSGGPLPAGNYKFVQMHFHWGGNDSVGSEHTLDGTRYPIEVHLVHFHENYTVFNDAMGQVGGVVVLAVWLDLVNSKTRYENEVLQPVVKSLKKIKNMHEVTRVWGFKSLYDVLPRNTNTYFHYDGSLTTPSCNENVLWIIFKSPQSISHTQLEAFRSLNEERVGALSLHHIENNFRHTQPLYDRTIYLIGSSFRSNANPATLAMQLAVSCVFLRNV